MEYYLADYIENLYYHQLFVYAKPIWVVLIKNGLDLETFFLHNGFSNAPSNSIKFHQSMALSKTQFFSSDYVWNHISHVIISSHSNKSVNIYFISDLRQKKANKIIVQYHLWYWKCRHYTMNFFLSKTDNWLPIKVSWPPPCSYILNR